MQRDRPCAPFRAFPRTRPWSAPADREGPVADPESVHATEAPGDSLGAGEPNSDLTFGIMASVAVARNQTPKPASGEQLRRIDAYWRAANYLSVGTRAAPEERRSAPETGFLCAGPAPAARRAPQGVRRRLWKPRETNSFTARCPRARRRAKGGSRRHGGDGTTLRPAPSQGGLASPTTSTSSATLRAPNSPEYGLMPQSVCLRVAPPAI